MKTTTELIDEMNQAEEGEHVTVRTDTEEYEGDIEATHYAAPESREEGVVGIDVRTEGGDFDGELLEIRSTAGSSTQKFSRPVVRLPEEEDDHEVLDLSRSRSDR
jgi:TusA-related sulfurtransferase